MQRQIDSLSNENGNDYDGRNKTESSFWNEKLNQTQRQIDSLSNENGNDYGGKYENGKLIFEWKTKPKCDGKSILCRMKTENIMAENMKTESWFF